MKGVVKQWSEMLVHSLVEIALLGSRSLHKLILLLSSLCCVSVIMCFGVYLWGLPVPEAVFKFFIRTFWLEFCQFLIGFDADSLERWLGLALPFLVF